MFSMMDIKGGFSFLHKLLLRCYHDRCQPAPGQSPLPVTSACLIVPEDPGRVPADPARDENSSDFPLWPRLVCEHQNEQWFTLIIAFLWQQ